MFGRIQKSAHVRVWADVPELAIPENPAIFCDANDLWLAYETTAEPRGENCAIVRFYHVIDHRLSPINDEGLGQHHHASAGLKFYSFNEIIDSAETHKWSALQARYWVITFKDVTLDVIAQSVTVIRDRVPGVRPAQALLSVVATDCKAQI
jgi:hypothetical protein